MANDTAAPTVGSDTLSKLFNITPTRIEQLAKMGVVVKSARGKYDLWASIKGYVKYLQDRSFGKQGGSDTTDISHEKHRHERAKADLAERKLLILNRKLLDAEAVVSIWSDIGSAVKSKVLSIATKAAPIVADKSTPVECKHILEGFCAEALTEIANMDASAIAKRSVLAAKLADSVGGEDQEEKAEYPEEIE